MSITNPLLIKVKMPGRVYPLPSMGVFYAPGVLAPSVDKGEIQVHPMSALAEMKIRSADLLFSGKVIKELVDECAPEILKPEALLTQDVDALFAYLRQVTYGDNHTVVTSHDCANAHQHEHRVDLGPIIRDPRNSILAHKEDLYRIELSNGQVVHTKPATYKEAMESVHMRAELHRAELNGEKINDDKLTEITVFEILSVVASVEVVMDEKVINVPDRKLITEWIKALPRKQLDELLASVKRSNDWGYDFKTMLRCPDCKQPFEYQLELDPISFFFG